MVSKSGHEDTRLYRFKKDSRLVRTAHITVADVKKVTDWFCGEGSEGVMNYPERG